MLEGVLRPRFFLDGLAFVAAYVALDWISFIYAFSPLGFTPWNPQSGLSLAFLLRGAPANAVWLLPAALLADWVVRDWPAPPGLAFLSALVLSVGYAGAAHLLRRHMRFDATLATLRDVMLLFALGMAAELVIAFLYAGLFAVAGLIPWSDFPPAAFRHWVGDIIGIAVATPLLLRFPPPNRGHAWMRPDLREVTAQLLSVPLVLWVVFGLPQTDEFKFFYLLFLPVIWASVRHGLDGAVIAIAATQLGLIFCIQLKSYGHETVVEFQMLMLALAFTGLLIGAVVRERQRTQDALYESEKRLRQRQSELAQFSRASAIGEMASTLAHEISQPLSATTTYLSACSRLLGAPQADLGRIREAIAKAESQAKRAGHVLAGLRDFLYRGETHLVPLPAFALVESVAALAQGEIERIGVEMIVSDATGGAFVLVDRIQVEQAMLNLVRNAAESLSESRRSERRLTIDARADAVSVEFAVSDTGAGIAPEITERLFQPFVSSKERGMGLGLTITRSIVEAHGGRLWFEPLPGGGATFRLTLPRTDER